MAKSRYRNVKSYENEEEVYEGLREQRKLKRVRQYVSPRMTYPSEEIRRSLMEISHPWAHGDKYWKLAETYYGDPKYWWVIAWYNLKPTDVHCKIGEIILVPKPLGKVLKYCGY